MNMIRLVSQRFKSMVEMQSTFNAKNICTVPNLIVNTTR
jgi:hypothetical protein